MSSINPWPMIPPFNASIRTNDVQPFTYQDGETYLEKLARMKAKLDTIIDSVNTGFFENNEYFADTVTKLITDVNAVVENIDTNVETRLTEYGTEIRQTVATDVGVITASLDTRIDDLQTDIDVYLSQQITNNDGVTQTLVQGPSATRTALNTVVGDAIGDALDEASFPASAIGSGTFDTARIPTATEAVAGSARRATKDEATNEVEALAYLTPLRLVDWERSRKLPTAVPRLPGFVVIGNSNATALRPSPTENWPTLYAAKRNMIQYNYAVDSISFMSSGTNYLSRAQAAVANISAANRALVGEVFVVDGSSDARDSRTFTAVRATAIDVYTTLRQGFPNARIIVLPMIWPADSKAYTPANIYTKDTAGRVIRIASAMRDALLGFKNVLFIENSWSWLTAKTELMIGPFDVHPNAAGHKLIADYVERAVNGEAISGFTERVNVTARTNYGVQNGTGTPIERTRSLGVRLATDIVTLDGGVWTGVAAPGSNNVVGDMPAGFRPPASVTGSGVMTGTQQIVPVEVWEDGSVRVYGPFTEGQGVIISMSWPLF